MKGLLRPKSLLFGALAVVIGSASGAVLAAHTIHPAAPSAAISVNFAGHEAQSQTEASPEPEATASPEASPEPEATETPEAEPNEAVEPNEEPAEHPTPTPTISTTSSSQTFSLVGGTVTLSCPAAGAIMLDSATPNPGFSFEQGTEDGDQTIEVRFESSSHESRLQADCAGGQVQVLELREESN